MEVGRPNSLLTLTVDPSNYPDPLAALKDANRKWSRLVAEMRKCFGKVEYVRVWELHRSGWPHAHIAMRAPYLPHGWISRRWAELGVGSIVDIRRVKQPERAAGYLLKYMSADFGSTQAALPRVRLINRSRGWLGPGQREALEMEAKAGIVSSVAVRSMPYSWVVSELAKAGAQVVEDGIYGVRVKVDLRCLGRLDVDERGQLAGMTASVDRPPGTEVDLLDTLGISQEEELDPDEPKEEQQELF